MGRILENATQLIGRTPLLRLSNYARTQGLDKARIFGKLEYLNPAGSVKDRIALAMIEDAENRGLLVPGATIIEPTSGNTGIGLAAVAAIKGYKILLTLPDTMSVERRNLLKAYGARLELTEGAKGMRGAIERAREIQAETPGSLILGQFDNGANPEAHYRHTGPEIWEDAQGQVDVLVAGVGTGGTISGAGKYLKERNPRLWVAAVEPKDSPVLSGGAAGPHKIQGIGAGFVPATLDTEVYDQILPIGNEEAMEHGRLLARSEGILAGISSGAALAAAAVLAREERFAGKSIVVVLPDSGDRYLSTAMFQEE